MKKLFIVFIIIIAPIFSYSQNSINKPAFSVFSFGLYGGFSTIDFNDKNASALMEVKTNLSENIFLHFSVGHYLFDKTEQPSTVSLNEFNNKKINSGSFQHKVTPVSIGITYFIVHGHSTPYLTFEAGHNFYENPNMGSENVKEDPFNFGLGAGIFHNWQKHWKLDIRYIYKSNDTFDNINHIVVGCIYSF